MLYKYFKIEISINKCKSVVGYSTGVKQGNNLASCHFVIVIQFLVSVKKTQKKLLLWCLIFTMILTCSINVVS